MAKLLTVMGCAFVTLPSFSVASDGFMQDFFQRFPHLPFGNINSFRYLHDQGSMSVTDSLIPAKDDYPFRKYSNDKYVKSKDRSSNNEISSPATKRPKTTPNNNSRNKKRLLFSKSKYSKTTTGAVKSSTKSSKYQNFKIVSTTPAYAQKDNLSDIESSKIKGMQNSFYSYSDQYNSRYFLYPQNDDDFHTQLLKPKLMSDSQYFAFDPFLQTPGSLGARESTTVTLERHFYYGDTTTMKPAAKYKIRKQKKKGIVINEKALSGEVHNVKEITEENSQAPVTTTASTTYTRPPTTSTTTLDPSSVSEMPTMVISELPDRVRIKPPKYHYRLTTTIPPYRRPDILSHSKYEFDKFMPHPRDPPPAPDSAQSPKLKYTYTTIKTTVSPIRPETKVVVMPPYTPAPNQTTRKSEETTTTSSAGSIQLTPEETGGGNKSDPESGGGSDPDIESEVTSNNSHAGNKYTYKLRGGHVDYVTRPPLRHNDKVLHLFRNPQEAVRGHGYRPPLFYERPPPRYPPPHGSPLPPLAPHHYQPYPYHVPQHDLNQEHYDELPPEHKAQQFNYHSKIKYMPKEEKPSLKYKYSTTIKVQKDKPKKYLPHNKIIKATFYEDQKLIENNDDENGVEKTSDASVDEENTLEKPVDNDQDHPMKERSLSKSPKLIRTQYSANNRMEEGFDESKLFKQNLREIMSNQFQIQPTDFLSGFLPVRENNPRAGKNARNSWNLGNNRIRKLKMERPEPATSVTKSTTTTTRPSSAHTDNGEQNLRDNYSELTENTNKYPRKQHNILELILQKYKSKPHTNIVKEERNVPKPPKIIMKAKSLSPVQSIKENLFGRFLKYFRGEPLKKKFTFAEPKQFSPPSTTTSPLYSQPEREADADSPKQEEERLPNEFLDNIGRHKNAANSAPPSSQDSYKRFLLKLDKQKGRNES